MKRIGTLGILILAAPLAGCATFSLSNLTSLLPGLTPNAPSAKQGTTANLSTPPADLESAIMLAQAQRRAGDFAAATKLLSQLVLIAPDDARVLGEYGKTLVSQGRTDDALAFLERAVQLQPGDWTLHSAQGVAFDQKGNYRAAQVAFAQALFLKPGEPSVLNNAALSHMQAGDLDSAERLLRQASGANDPRIAENLALVQNLRSSQPKGQAAPSVPAAIASTETPLPAPFVSAAAAPAPAEAPVPSVTATPVTTAELASPSVAQAAPQTLPALPPAVETQPEITPDLRGAVENTVVPSAAPVETAAPVVAAAAVEPPKPVVEAKPAAAVQNESPAANPRPVAAAKPAPTPVTPAPKIPMAPATPAAGPVPANRIYYLQAGAFYRENQAGAAASTLDVMGAQVVPGTYQGRPMYRVKIGPFLTTKQANAAMVQAKSLGHNDLFIDVQYH